MTSDFGEFRVRTWYPAGAEDRRSRGEPEALPPPRAVSRLAHASGAVVDRRANLPHRGGGGPLGFQYETIHIRQGYRVFNLDFNLDFNMDSKNGFSMWIFDSNEDFNTSNIRLKKNQMHLLIRPIKV